MFGEGQQGQKSHLGPDLRTWKLLGQNTHLSRLNLSTITRDGKPAQFSTADPPNVTTFMRHYSILQLKTQNCTFILTLFFCMDKSDGRLYIIIKTCIWSHVWHFNVHFRKFENTNHWVHFAHYHEGAVARLSCCISAVLEREYIKCCQETVRMSAAAHVMSSCQCNKLLWGATIG